MSQEKYCIYVQKREKGGIETNPSYGDIISNIKRLIDEKGMKQGVVAERAGFTKQEFSNIMNDRRKLLRVEHSPAIAYAMGVDVNALCEVEKKEVG
jgi:transcriptional regulator with XRE-family HTH domain